MVDNSTLADQFLDHHAPNDWFRDPNFNRNGGVRAVNPHDLPILRDALVDFIANVVASILDAGSERDAVNESEALHAVIEDELMGWTADLRPRNPNELLMRMLHLRFDYTRDNNRDLSDGTGSYADDQVEIDMTHAYLTIINYLTYQGD